MPSFPDILAQARQNEALWMEREELRRADLMEGLLAEREWLEREIASRREYLQFRRAQRAQDLARMAEEGVGMMRPQATTAEGRTVSNLVSSSHCHQAMAAQNPSGPTLPAYGQPSYSQLALGQRSGSLPNEVNLPPFPALPASVSQATAGVLLAAASATAAIRSISRQEPSNPPQSRAEQGSSTTHSRDASSPTGPPVSATTGAVPNHLSGRPAAAPAPLRLASTATSAVNPSAVSSASNAHLSGQGSGRTTRPRPSAAPASSSNLRQQPSSTAQKRPADNLPAFRHFTSGGQKRARVAADPGSNGSAQDPINLVSPVESGPSRGDQGREQVHQMAGEAYLRRHEGPRSSGGRS